MGRSKALLPFENETFLDHLIGVFSTVCDSVTVVLGYQHEAIRAGLLRQAHFCVNPAPERGQFSSMLCGLAELPDCDAFFFTPVDYPAITTRTVATLKAALARDSSVLLAIPRFEGKHGHPVFCRAALRNEFLDLPGDGQARHVVKRHLASTLYVDIDDPGTITDVDDPEAYAKLLSGTRSV